MHARTVYLRLTDVFFGTSSSPVPSRDSRPRCPYCPLLWTHVTASISQRFTFVGGWGGGKGTAQAIQSRVEGFPSAILAQLFSFSAKWGEHDHTGGVAGWEGEELLPETGCGGTNWQREDSNQHRCLTRTGPWTVPCALDVLPGTHSAQETQINCFESAQSGAAFTA